MARYAYVNGRYVEHRDASVHIEDRGYQLADGVYEVVGVRDGKLIDETPHIDRLDRSLRELRIAWPVSRATLGFIIRELMRRNRLRDGLVYMQVTRGVARRDHAFPTTEVKPALVLYLPVNRRIWTAGAVRWCLKFRSISKSFQNESRLLRCHAALPVSGV